MPPFMISLVAGFGLLIGLMGGTFLAVSKIKLPPPPMAAEQDSTPNTTSPRTFDDFSKVASELDSWRRELTERNNKALLLDAELSRREQVLQVERAALDKERDRLTKVQKDMEDRLIKIKENEVPRLQELADLYTSMKPDDAVMLLRALPQDQATKIMTVMKQKVIAKLLDAWLQQFPADKDVVAQITNDLVRTMNQTAADETASAAGPSATDSAPSADAGTAPASAPSP